MSNDPDARPDAVEFPDGSGDTPEDSECSEFGEFREIISRLRRQCSPELDDLAYRTIGAAMEVHTTLGPGLSESIYERALVEELSRRKIPFQRQVPVRILYKGVEVGFYRLDL